MVYDLEYNQNNLFGIPKHKDWIFLFGPLEHTLGSEICIEMFRYNFKTVTQMLKKYTATSSQVSILFTILKCKREYFNITG